MKRTTTKRRRRTTSGSLGIPGLKLPRGVPTLVRSVGRLFGGRAKGAGAARGASGGAWIWVVLGLALAAWIAWDALNGGRGPSSHAEVVSHAEGAEDAEVLTHAEGAEDAEVVSRAEGAEDAEVLTHAEGAEDAEVLTHAEGAESTEVLTRAEGTKDAEVVSRAEGTEIAEPQKDAARTSKPPAWKDGDWVRGQGVVTKVLPDDTVPPRHQRFLVRDDWGRTFLFAHNIDVAKRVEGLAAGDEIRFRGEYRINAEGGVVHWTHAPTEGGRGPGGWIERAGVTYK